MRRSLLRLFLRSRSLRLGGFAVALVSFGLLTLVAVVSGLRDGPDVQALQTLGRAGHVMSLVDSVPIGTANSPDQTDVVKAIRAQVRGSVAIEYVASRVRPDSGSSVPFALRESSDVAFTNPSVRLVTGHWATAPGEVLVSNAAATIAPVGTRLRFFSGELQLRVVGVFREDVSRGEYTFQLAPGTWAGAPRLPVTRAATLQASATRNFYWSDGSPDRVLAAANAAISHSKSLRASTAFNAPQVQNRSDFSQPLGGIPQLEAASVLAPLLAGLMIGALGGRFVSRTRRLMWTLGVDLAATRTSAIAAVCAACLAGAIAGLGTAATILPATLWVTNLFSAHTLAAQTLLLQISLVALASSVAGGIVGSALSSTPRRQTFSQRAALSNNIWLAGFVIFVGLIALGAFAVQGATDPASLSIGGLAFGGAALVVILALGGQLLRLEPRALVLRLAVRRAREDARTTFLLTYLVGFLGITGVALSILLMSTYAAFNAGQVPLVPKDQIVFEPELPHDADNTLLAGKFRAALQLQPPIVEHLTQEGSDEGDGATLVVNSPEEVSAVTGARLSSSAIAFLRDGGALTSSYKPSGSIHFSADGKFRGATLPTQLLKGANVSFVRRDSIILTSTALAANLKPEAPAFVFTNTTAFQRSQVRAVVAKLGIYQAWVETYRAPDTALPPSSFLVVSGALVGLTSLVAFFITWLDSKSLALTSATLLTLGLGRRFVAGVLVAKTAIVVSSAMVASVLASFVGTSIAFSFGRLKIPLVAPLPEVGLQLLITLLIALGGSAMLAGQTIRPRASIADSLIHQ